MRLRPDAVLVRVRARTIDSDRGHDRTLLWEIFLTGAVLWKISLSGAVLWEMSLSGAVPVGGA